MCCGQPSEEDIASVAAIREEQMPETKSSEWVPGLPLAIEWHSKSGDVYHDNPACPEASKVPMSARRPGAAGLPHCTSCDVEAPKKGKGK